MPGVDRSGELCMLGIECGEEEVWRALSFQKWSSLEAHREWRRYSKAGVFRTVTGPAL